MKGREREAAAETVGGNEETECDGEVMEWRFVTAAHMFTCFFVFLMLFFVKSDGGHLCGNTDEHTLCSLE